MKINWKITPNLSNEFPADSVLTVCVDECSIVFVGAFVGAFVGDVAGEGVGDGVGDYLYIY